MSRIICTLGRAPGLAWAGAAELAWHALGPAWAFAVLAAALAWLTTWLPAAIAAVPAAAEKAYAVEDRLNALVPKIPSPKAAPAAHSDSTSGPGDGSYSASNSSYAMGGGTLVSYNPQGSGNNGGSNSNTSGVGAPAYTGGADNGGVTSGQIGGASQHYHDMSHAHGNDHDHSMTHYHTSSGDLQNVVNSTQGSHTTLVSTVNALKSSHSSLVSSMQGLQASHAALSDRHNELLTALKNTKLLT